MHILKLGVEFPFWSFQWWPQKSSLISFFKVVKNTQSRSLNQKYSDQIIFCATFYAILFLCEKMNLR